MNVNLIFKQTGYNFQISQYTPLSFIYEVAHKVFRIPPNSIKLFYKEQHVPNEQIYASIYFKKFPVIINILEIKESSSSNQNEKIKATEEKSFSDTFSDKAKHKKKNFIKCQICTRKNSIFYCRNCNQFICFECNLRYPEHFSHKKISLESGDLLLCFEDYRNSVLDQLNELNNAYRFSSENIYTDNKRSELFENLMKSLKDLDKKTQSLTIMGTSYKCNNELLNSFNKELREIEPPKYKEETINSFGLVNEKELEIQNYISFVNLQILKSKFNIKMTIFFKHAKKIFDDLTTEINNKLHDSLYLKEKDYNDLVTYNKEKYKEQMDNTSYSRSRSNSYSSSNHTPNKSSYSINNNSFIQKNEESSKNFYIDNTSNNNKNDFDNNNNKYSNNIGNKNDLNDNIMKKNKLTKNEIFSRNGNKSHENILNFRQNQTEGNINRIQRIHSNTIKEDIEENNESNDENFTSLPKIKIGNDSNNDINNNRKKLFSPSETYKKNNIFNLKSINSINSIKKSMQNLLIKSQSQSRELKKIKKRNNNINTLKLISKENPFNSIEIEKKEKSNAQKTLQSSSSVNNKYKYLKLKSINSKENKDIDQLNEENKKNCVTIGNKSITTKSLDKYVENKILTGLKKVKHNRKLKLYDTYDDKENEENDENDSDLEKLDYKAIVMKLMKRKSVKKKTIYQKEK